MRRCDSVLIYIIKAPLFGGIFTLVLENFDI